MISLEGTNWFFPGLCWWIESREDGSLFSPAPPPSCISEYQQCTSSNGFVAVYNFVVRIILACMPSQTYSQAWWDEQCLLPLTSHPLHISIKRCHWRRFCKVSHRVWAAQCMGQRMLRCLCAAQLFISYFCIYKRLIHEAPATQGKQLFGDSSILLLFFFPSGFSSIISPLFLQRGEYVG